MKTAGRGKERAYYTPRQHVHPTSVATAQENRRLLLRSGEVRLDPGEQAVRVHVVRFLVVELCVDPVKRKAELVMLELVGNRVQEQGKVVHAHLDAITYAALMPAELVSGHLVALGECRGNMIFLLEEDRAIGRDESLVS